MRQIAAHLIAPLLALAGQRFGKHHRHEETLAYRLIDTVLANALANRIRRTA